MLNTYTKSSSTRKRLGLKMFSKVVLVLLLSFSNLTFAQPSFDDDVNDEAPAVPIHSGLYVVLGLGVALGFYSIEKKRTLQGNKI